MTRDTAPPPMRSRQGFHFSAAAARGRLQLQWCRSCDSVCYPPREACPLCWSADLRWESMPEGGRLVTETTLHSSFSRYFSARLPWRIGTVLLDAGPAVLAHVHGQVDERSRVRVIARTDESGQGVLMALPEKDVPNMAEDRQLQTLTCNPRGRTVLVTQAAEPEGAAIARALVTAGAARVYAGFAGDVSPDSLPAALRGLSAMQPVALDVGDASSVARLAKAIGGDLDILVHGGSAVRAGAATEQRSMARAREDMEASYFGLLRLVQAFAPALQRGAGTGDTGLRAWVNVMSVLALANRPAYGTSAAGQAAAWSLSQALRAECAGQGIKVICVLAGPPGDGAGVEGGRVAAAVVQALEQGIEIAAVGPVAEDLVRRYADGPLALERELMQPGQT